MHQKMLIRTYDINNLFHITDDYFKIVLPNLNPINFVINNVSNNLTKLEKEIC